MKNKHQRFEPLMYIEQANERVSQPVMQETYSSLHNKVSQESHSSHSEQKNPPQKKRKRTYQRHLHVNPIAELEDTGEDGGNEVETKDRAEDQSFADLSIEEKIEYCTSTSNYIPKIHCMIKTEERTTIGTIANFEEGIVRIRPQRSRNFVEIPIGDIISIRMTGF